MFIPVALTAFVIFVWGSALTHELEQPRNPWHTTVEVVK